jgi:hypothetical protein
VLRAPNDILTARQTSTLQRRAKKELGRRQRRFRRSDGERCLAHFSALKPVNPSSTAPTGVVMTPPELAGLKAEDIATADQLRVALKRGRERIARRIGEASRAPVRGVTRVRAPKLPMSRPVQACRRPTTYRTRHR